MNCSLNKTLQFKQEIELILGKVCHLLELRRKAAWFRLTCTYWIHQAGWCGHVLHSLHSLLSQIISIRHCCIANYVCLLCSPLCHWCRYRETKVCLFIILRQIFHTVNLLHLLLLLPVLTPDTTPSFVLLPVTQKTTITASSFVQTK